ncbi:DNA-binding FadR family transcriptional regulator [Amycolatopsis bartoniae]|uniref:GntR family transcriptional regulator n=1 Tax=Amycolatopsis bartoniae TaxID=941986 RepID=A0A8H9J2B1_9PSEU|nr:FCD domain-containing protein [Amycolatopsis bartoniae]MBB2938818.1 DNA-binding FadR family transcriptional regulator [Amycolatopsis bartoniae]TVS99582.1 FadR family transcriptional regulator [Amycolatopsis bartoniae]GHF89178.1 GntR family transcriptional regulator [Amycolatopsis bartoniae]
MRKSPSARSVLFAPLDQTGRVEAVTRRLVDAITLGLLADEEQLPSEAELAGQFGVSTVTVREALMALRQQGLLETRRGRGGGSFVRAPRDESRHATTWRERLREVSLSELRDIGDHYVAIAGTAARLAAERSSTEDLTRLELAAEDLRGATGAAASRAERQFHLEVAAASQSPRLTQQEVWLQSEQGALLWLPLGHDPDDTACTEHRAITAAIGQADGDLARKLTEEHILNTVDRLAELHLDLLGS